MKTILFLDFDGVLHPFPMPADRAQLFCNLPRLEAVLRDFPDVQIVISSSWRESRSLAELAALFSPDMAGRIIGVLPIIEVRSLDDAAAVRYREIQQFLAGGPAQWLALDDDPALFPESCPNLILCENGFGAAEEESLRQALMRAGVPRLTPPSEAEFLARGRASLAKARKTGKTISSKSVITELDKMIDAKFGPGNARKCFK